MSEGTGVPSSDQAPKRTLRAASPAGPVTPRDTAFSLPRRWTAPASRVARRLPPLESSQQSRFYPSSNQASSVFLLYQLKSVYVALRKHLAAYLLLQTGGNASPSAADVKALLETVGIEADAERLEKLVSELEGKDVNELIVEGTSKLASVPSGGAAPAAAAGGAAAAAGGADAPAAEEKKEEAKEESDDDMGFGLFD
ncbi:60S acidic ribosomal protein P2 [Vanrija albida]|uniref:60S acidic ribosomal protein P2 n=1 Tax=Vanrija albida TaxID=181172 RepID=A0ABR3Q8S1_9TREE